MDSFFCAIIAFLDEWQTLVGSVIGGVVGLLAALLVAHDARRREERAAAMLLTIDITSVLASKEALDERIEKHQIKAEDEPQWVTDRLMNARPQLSPLFEASIVRVMPVDIHLAAHLSLFRTIYSGVLEMVERLVKANDFIKSNGKMTLTEEEVASNVRLIHSGFLTACKHAECAEHLLDRYVIRKTAMLYRLGKALRLVKHENKCHELLSKG
jgi:hypothetical protein